MASNYGTGQCHVCQRPFNLSDLIVLGAQVPNYGPQIQVTIRVCPDCSRRQEDTYEDDQNNDEDYSDYATADDLEYVQNDLKNAIGILDSRVQSVIQECVLLKGENVELRQAVEVLSECVNDKERKITKLQDTVVYLQNQLDASEENILSYELELIGIPERPNENLMEIILKVAIKGGILLSEYVIDNVYRIKSRESKAAYVPNPGQVVYDPIVVRFARILIRDNVLKRLQSLPNITTLNIVDSEPVPVLVCERLIQPVRELFLQTFLRAIKYNYCKCVYVNGDIWVRREEGEMPQYIRSMDDVERLIGPSTPPLYLQ